MLHSMFILSFSPFSPFIFKQRAPWVVHTRSRDLVPLLQDTEHFSQAPHCDQTPYSKSGKADARCWYHFFVSEQNVFFLIVFSLFIFIQSFKTVYAPWQTPLLQPRASWLLPGQLSPWLRGNGNEQVLWRVCMPSPQDWLHMPQSCQADQ